MLLGPISYSHSELCSPKKRKKTFWRWKIKGSQCWKNWCRGKPLRVNQSGEITQWVEGLKRKVSWCCKQWNRTGRKSHCTSTNLEIYRPESQSRVSSKIQINLNVNHWKCRGNQKTKKTPITKNRKTEKTQEKKRRKENETITRGWRNAEINRNRGEGDQCYRGRNRLEEEEIQPNQIKKWWNSEIVQRTCRRTSEGKKRQEEQFEKTNKR